MSSIHAVLHVNVAHGIRDKPLSGPQLEGPVLVQLLVPALWEPQLEDELIEDGQHPPFLGFELVGVRAMCAQRLGCPMIEGCGLVFYVRLANVITFCVI